MTEEVREFWESVVWLSKKRSSEPVSAIPLGISPELILAVDAELTRLTAEVEQYRRMYHNVSDERDALLKSTHAERKAIAEAVREKYPGFIITEALAIGIERGEFAQKGEGQ